jgi:hypothetical protein
MSRSPTIAPSYITTLSHIAFRRTCVVFAVILGLQSIWLLLAQFTRPGIDYLPTTVESAAVAAKHRNDATWAAMIGVVRGDLWSESAYTYADLLWADPGTNAAPAVTLDQAHARLEKAIDYAPHQASVWVLLAGLAARYRWSDFNVTEALKMSYYTGPNDGALLPLRLRLAAQSETLDDTELQEFVRRDLRLLLASQRKSVVSETYDAASPAGKHFIQGAISEIDPPSLGLLRAGAQKP